MSLKPKDLNVQAISCFEIGAVLAIVFPSITKGLTIVTIGQSGENANETVAYHDCLVCHGYGHHECPYIQEANRVLMYHRQQRFNRYTVVAENPVTWDKLTRLGNQIDIPTKPQPERKEGVTT